MAPPNRPVGSCHSIGERSTRGCGGNSTPRVPTFASNSSTGPRESPRSANSISPPTIPQSNTASDRWGTSHRVKRHIPDGPCRQKMANGTKNHNTAALDVLRNEGDKWWHKFGYSRRGLEHIVSIKEGSERQANVLHAIRVVLEEQQRHKVYWREDPEKLRMVSIHNTAWARNLAVAAGCSDADAVTRNLDEERDRETD